MDAHLPDVYFNQCSTPKTRDIKWTHICQMSALINALPRKLVILNERTMSLNALPRKLVIKWTRINLMHFLNALPENS